jgi:hypothetical protein
MAEAACIRPSIAPSLLIARSTVSQISASFKRGSLPIGFAPPHFPFPGPSPPFFPRNRQQSPKGVYAGGAPHGGATRMYLCSARGTQCGLKTGVHPLKKRMLRRQPPDRERGSISYGAKGCLTSGSPHFTLHPEWVCSGARSGDPRCGSAPLVAATERAPERWEALRSRSSSALRTYGNPLAERSARAGHQTCGKS